MRALLDNVTVIHDKDQVCITDGGKTVRDDEAGTAAHQVVHGLLDPDFGSGIYGGGCLIQDQHSVVCKDCSCDGQQLFLSL